MTNDELTIRTRSCESVPPDILEMCNLAYGEDLRELWASFGPTLHITGMVGTDLVSHAMWVRHDLQPEGLDRLRTAYVEGVATLPDYRNRGYATRILQHLVDELPPEIELAALCPSGLELYRKSGWELWRGPLRVRMPGGEIEETSDEQIMIHHLPTTPPLDLESPILADWRPGEVW